MQFQLFQAFAYGSAIAWYRLLIALLLPTVSAGGALAVELPPLATLQSQHGVHQQTVDVIEPHASTPERPQRVRYRALPMDRLLTGWFGERWKAPGAEIVFLAKDGYRSLIAGSRLTGHRAYLAFARDDGAPFAVNNIRQNEQNIPLGPYYLIWDNRDAQELLRLGSYGWPYQVTRIELRSEEEDRQLLPSNAGPDIVEGLEDAKEYCLTCHQLRGVGGAKYPEDLLLATCRWNDAELKAWIAEPGRLRPGTAMPALNPLLPAAQRSELIERITGYLNALKADDPAICAQSAVSN